jgi:phosphoribosylanthranilate isomerase
MPPQVKICGLSTEATLDSAIVHGATHIGFVHYEPSPRHVALDRARALRDRIPAHVKSVLLLVNTPAEQTMQAIATVRPDIVQFHGTETPEWLQRVKQISGKTVWKALGLKDKATLATSDRYVGAADLLLFDAPAAALPGGTGLRFDWTVLDGHAHKLPWGLAGGLTPDTVAEAIRATRAPLVDVSSGVESAPGMKDVDKIAAFLKAAQS